MPLISVLTLSACQDDSEGLDTILVDYKYSPQEINLIIKAMNEWYDATDSTEKSIPLSLYFNSDADPVGFLNREEGSEAAIYKIKTTDLRYLALKEETGVDMFGAAKEFLHITLVEDSIRELVERKVFETYEKAFYKIALHEYGHFLGIIGHLSSPHSVMAGQVYTGIETCIDEETLEYYCSLKECGPNKHPTCKYNIEE